MRPVAGLLLPALDEGPAASALCGVAVGVLFLLLCRRALAARDMPV